MNRVVCLKDLPIEVDLGIEEKGFTPDYSKFGNATEEFDLRRVAIMIEGYQVAGIVDGGKFYVEAVLAPVKLNQKTLDAIEASEQDETEYLLSSEANADRLRASIAQLKS